MRTRIGWIVALVVVAVTPSARASHGPIDTLFVLNSMSLPALALDPTTGDRHVAYISDAILTHAWETAGVWQSEAIVDSASSSTYYSFQLRVAPDGHPVGSLFTAKASGDAGDERANARSEAGHSVGMRPGGVGGRGGCGLVGAGPAVPGRDHQGRICPPE